MKNLTRREQVLLFALLAILITAGFFLLVIQPLNKDIAANQAKLNELEGKKSEIDLKLASENAITANLEKATLAVNDKFARIESPLFAADFEKWTLPYLVNNQVVMTSLTVSEPELSAPNIPTYQNVGFSYELRDLVDSYNQVVENAKTIPMTEAQLVHSTVEFKFNTTYEIYVKFLDEIAFWDTTVFVTNTFYDFTQSSGTVRVEYYTSEKIITEKVPELN